MTSDNLEAVERLLHEAMKLAPANRAAFVANISEADVRDEVKSLLAAAGAGDTARIGTVLTDVATEADRQLSGRILGHFRILRPLGRGAMGEVYLAQDLKLGRQVALKVLPNDLQQNAERVRWFEREARAAAALNQPNIVTVYEVGEWEGRSFIASEFIEGETLAQKLSRGPLSVIEAARVGAQIADALAAAHRAGIVHRDLKPANIMLRPDGTVKVLDFGLARLSGPLAEFASADVTGTQTSPGRVVGTLSYMSPEQARAEVVDTRSDLWSFGVVLYESLSGQRPFAAANHSEIIAAILDRDPAPVRSVNRAIPSGFADLVSSLLIKDREKRLSSADEAGRRLKRLVETVADRKARTLRRQWIAAAVVVLLAIVAASGWLVYRWSKRQWARYEAIPLAHALVDRGDYVGVYRLALETASHIPNDPALQRLWPEVSQLLSVRSEPPGAEIVWNQYAQLNAPWQRLGRTPLEKIRVPAGPLRIQARMAGYQPVEAAVDKISPRELSTSDYIFRLDPANSPHAQMVRVPAKPAASGALAQSGSMPEFEIDRYEVTNRDFKDFVNRGGYRNREFWKIPFIQDGRTLSREEAMAQFVDPTGRPGPATWEAGTYPPGQDDYPVSGVSWYEAAAYAEFAGKSLPTTAHWLRASNLDVVESDYRFLVPLSNFESGHPQAVGASGAVNTFGLYDMAGNVREWCWNETGGRHAILGGSWADKAAHLIGGDQDNAAAFDRSATNGFRCIRYSDRERALREFGGPRTPAHWPDYYKVRPVSDEVFDLYKGLYAYDKKPLTPAVESVDESSDLWRREKIRFQAPYGNEQVIAYLFLPKQGQPPYQCVLYMADGATLHAGSGDTIRPESYILRSGRAMLYPIFKGTLDRYRKFPPDPLTQRDLTIAWHKDLSSSVDYLQMRPDVDASKLAYMGHSMGTRFAPMMLATEHRVKAAVLLAGAMRPAGALPEADPINFLPRVTIPILHVTGKYDSGYPVELAQNPFFDLLGTSPKDKRHVILPVGHAILVPEVRTTVVREVLDWLDHYLGVT